MCATLTNLLKQQSSRLPSTTTATSQTAIFQPPVIATMIFNTKTMTPMQGSPNSFVRPNDYIPGNSSSSGQESKANAGRQICYETILVSTPVLVSARLNPKDPSPTKRVLTKSDVDELNQMLNSLCVGHDKAEPVATTTKQVEASTRLLNSSKSSRVAKREVSFAVEETKQDDEGVEINYDTTNEGLGRYQERVGDAKSQTTKFALRSYRIKAMEPSLF